jgi:hypothetical protein
MLGIGAQLPEGAPASYSYWPGTVPHEVAVAQLAPLTVTLTKDAIRVARQNLCRGPPSSN